MGMDDAYSSRPWSDSMALVETPLILPANSHYNHHFNTAIYPYNLSVFQGGSGSGNSNSHGNGAGGNGHSYPEHINGSGGGSSSVDNIFIDTDVEDNAIFEKPSTGECEARRIRIQRVITYLAQMHCNIACLMSHCSLLTLYCVHHLVRL